MTLAADFYLSFQNIWQSCLPRIVIFRASLIVILSILLDISAVISTAFIIQQMQNFYEGNGIDFSLLLGQVFIVIGSITFRLFCSYYLLKQAMESGNKLTSKIFENMLQLPLDVAEGSYRARAQDAILVRVRDVIFQSIFPFLQILASISFLIVALGLMIFVLNIDVWMFFICLCILISVLLLFRFLNYKIIMQGKVSANKFSIASSSFSWFAQDLWIHRWYARTCGSRVKYESVNKVVNDWRYADFLAKFYAVVAKTFFEILIFSGLVFVFYYGLGGELTLLNTSVDGFSFLGAAGILGQRLVQVAQQIIAGTAAIAHGAENLKIVIDVLEFKPATRNKKLALDQWTLGFPMVEKGLVAVVGASGAGKTSLLSLLVGERLSYCEDIGRMAGLRNGLMCVSELPSIDFPIRDFLEWDNLDWAALSEYWSRLGLNDELGDLGSAGELSLKSLSSGQKQRVAVARTLALCPTDVIVVFDEPTANLDLLSEQRMLELLGELSQRKLIFVISHSEKVRESADEVIRIE